MAKSFVHYYRKTDPSHSLLPGIKEELKDLNLADESGKIVSVETESCFNVLLDTVLSEIQTRRLEWLLAETFEQEKLSKGVSALSSDGSSLLCEFGPRMTFTSAFSSNATSICQACDLPISRLERSRRYRFSLTNELSIQATNVIKSMLHDRMTEEEYPKPLTTFESGVVTKPVRTIPIIEEGRKALEDINNEMGLGFDDFDLDYYTNLFKVNDLSRIVLTLS
jgi:phosphoribosylformylglycinamidine synthase